MQKVYQRINWENDPSTNTPINEDNLNKMDYALDKIDDRVVNLSGYETRVAESEKNAKQSEINAKESEINAKESELKAKEYKEQAFAGTPEGYQALVKQVGLLDIMKSTDTTIHNTKPGGYRLNELVGATVQNGEPSPDNPIAIENTFDCVEMIVGGHNTTTGAYASSYTSYICNKHSIPCKASDTIKVEVEDEQIGYIWILWYGDSGYISNNKVNANIGEFVAPSNAKYFNINVGQIASINPQTVGKITLTVNGKYVGQFVEVGKNFLKPTLVTTTQNGVTCTNNGDGTYTLNGTATSKCAFYVYDKSEYWEVGKKYRLVGCPKNGSSTGYFLNCLSGATGYDDTGNGKTFEITESIKTYTSCRIHVMEGISCNNVVFKPMLVDADLFPNVTYDDFEPYQEKVTTFFLNEPLRATDRVVKVDGVHMENHKKRSIVINENTNISLSNTNSHGISNFYIKLSDATEIAHKTNQCKCSHLVENRNLIAYATTEGFLPTSGGVYFRFFTSRFATVEELKAWLVDNPIYYEYELAEETFTPLDTTSQLELNDMETFDGVTYLEVDSKVKPTSISGEYGTSQVGAYTIECLNAKDTDTIERKLAREERETLRNMILSLGGNV